MSSNQELEALFKQVNEMTFATQYEQAANLIAQFLENADESLTQSERFHLRGKQCFCLYHNRDYELARDTANQLMQDREREGAFDLNYLHEVKILALALRGLCQYEESITWLNSILKQLKKLNEPPGYVLEMIAELEKHIEDTNKIKNNEPVDEFRIESIGVKGLFGTETIAVADLEVPRVQSALHCEVQRLEFSFQNFYRCGVEIEFSLDNQLAMHYVSVGADSARPILLILAYPRGGKVHHGDFEVRLAGDDGPVSNQEVEMENHFFNVIHPNSYHPRSKHPIPICKKFRYIKADCSVFSSPIPARAKITFSGCVEFSPKPGDCKELAVSQKFWLLFPYGQVALPPAKFHPVESDDFNFVSGTLARTAFRQDQTAFRAGEYIIEGPGPEPIMGPVSPIDKNELNGSAFNLFDMDLLAIEARMIPKQPILATIRSLADVIPTGTINYLPLLKSRKDPNSEEQSFFDLEGAEPEFSSEERRPLANVLLENYSAEKHSLKVSVSCEPLALQCEESIEIAPWQRLTVPVLPQLDQNPPQFHGWQSSADLAQAIRDCPITMSIREQKGGERSASFELVSKRSHTRALPPDFMAWTISEPSDGRIVDLRLLVARWVTPQAAAVVKLMEESNLLRTTGDPIEDLRRVYDRVAAMKIDYDMSRISVGAEMSYRFQRVRTPTVTLASRKMNCIDGCLLFASCMESIGYSPITIFLPGHAIFAIILAGSLAAVERLLLLETTMVCSQDDHGPFDYQEALVAGMEQFSAHEKYLVPRDSQSTPRPYSDTGFPLHRIVPLEWARRYGVQPFDDS